MKYVVEHDPSVFKILFDFCHLLLRLQDRFLFQRPLVALDETDELLALEEFDLR
jgi:hypothetical protein